MRKGCAAYHLGGGYGDVHVEKEYAFEHAKKVADKFDAEKYLNAPRPYPTTLAQNVADLDKQIHYGRWK